MADEQYIPISVLREYMPKLKDEDLKELGPIEYDQSKIPAVSKKHAENVRRKVYLPDMTESFARGVEYAGLIASEAVDISNDTKGRQDNVEAQFNSVQQELTDTDVISAPEIIAARNGEPTLSARLDKEKQETTAQLAQIHYNVKTEGAVGDGVTDDTQAIKNVISKANKGDTIYFPNGKYLTTDSIFVNKPLNIVMDGALLFDHEKVGLAFKDDSPNGSFHPDYHNKMTISGEINVERVQNKGYESQTSAVGVELWNVYSANLNIKKSLNNNVGVGLYGDKYGTGFAGTSYCMFTIGVLANYEKNILIRARNGGYVNQNQYYSGSFSGGYNGDVENIHIDFQHDPTGQGAGNNTFFGCSFEGGFKKAIKSRGANHNFFVYCRYEMPGAVLVFDLEKSIGFEFKGGFGLDDHMREGRFNDNSETINTSFTDTIVEFKHFVVGDVRYYDGIFYIQPKRRPLGKGDSVSNGISPSYIPESWKNVRIVTQGKSSLQWNPTSSNTTDGIMNINVSMVDEHIITGSASNPVEEIKLNTPPSQSQDIIVQKREPDLKRLSISSEFNNFIDKTGEGLAIPQGKDYARLYYSYHYNTLYLLETF